VIVLTEKGREKEAVLRLARVGFENCVGYVEGGFEAWKSNGGEIENMLSVDTAEYLKSQS